MIKFLKIFEELNTTKKVLLNIGIILFITFLDILTGIEIAFSIFYLIPISLITWTAGKNLGIIFSISAAVLWLMADEIGGRIYSYQIVFFWNTVVRLSFFLIVTFVLNTIKKQKETKEEFIHFLIHDLRSPVFNILSSFKILKEDSFAEEKVSRNEIIDLGAASGERIILLINSLLDLGRLENKKMPINSKELDINTVIETAIDQVRALCLEKDIKILTLGKVPNIKSDENLLVRIISNLLSNALKVSPIGSEIIIEVKDGNKDIILFNIEDQGPGIKKEMEEKLFGKYTQIETAKSGFTGSGLGLAFCKAAVQALKGKIWIENKMDRGAIVSFTIPVK